MACVGICSQWRDALPSAVAARSEHPGRGLRFSRLYGPGYATCMAAVDFGDSWLFCYRLTSHPCFLSLLFCLFHSHFHREIFPYLVVVIGLENVLVLTKSVVSTPVDLEVKLRIAQGER